MKQPAKSSQLEVIARAPFNLYYSGLAESVTATNKIGVFDILPGHADFFSVLDQGEVIIETGADSAAVTFSISNGIITVRNNQVMLFVNI